MRGILFSLLFLCSAAFAQTIYKSIDEQGNVIYSEQPPADARSVDIVPPPAEPSTTEVRAAEETQQRREQFIEESESERLEQAQQRQELRDYRQAPMLPTSVAIGAPGRQRGTLAEGGGTAEGADTARGASGAQGADTAGRPRPNRPVARPLPRGGGRGPGP